MAEVRNTPGGTPSKQNQPQVIGPRGPGGGPGGMNARMMREKPKDAKGTLLKLLRYIGKSKYLVLLLLVAVLFTTVLNLMGPSLQGKAIDAITLDPALGKIHVDFDSLVKTLILMGVVYVVSSLVQLCESLLSAKISQTTVYTLRKDLFRKISHLPIRYLDSHQHGDIMSRMTNDVDNVSNTISSSITSLFSGILTLIGALVMLLRYSWKMALISMITIPLTILVSTGLSKAMRKFFVQRQKLLGNLNGQIEEMVTGYKTVLAYGREQKACEHFAETSEEFRKCSIKANVWGGIMGPVMGNTSQVCYAITVGIGGVLMAVKGFGAGDLTVFANYSKQFSMPINMMSQQMNTIFAALAGAERVFNVMESEPEDKGAERSDDDQPIVGDVVLENVTFGYNPDKVILKNISLYAHPSQKIAFVGSTGAGKTTVTNLLNRFYDIDSGSITIDGKPLKEYNKDFLRENIAMVLQDTHLFTGTVMENIRYGRLDATDEEVIAAAKTASAHSFIMRLENGYDTVLEGDGANLSQGQRQLLNIARAAISKAPILVLDEATSSVDTRTERHIEHGMDRLMKNRTTFVIAHRLSTVRNSNAIMVLEAGEIIERGTHEQLLEMKGRYYELYTGKRELD